MSRYLVPLLALFLATTVAMGDGPATANTAAVGIILSLPAFESERDAVNASLVEAMTRLHFKRIGIERDWGPDHSIWGKLYPSFRSGYQELVNQWAQGANDVLADAFNRSLSETEKVEIARTMENPALQQHREVLVHYGLDLTSAVQALGISSSPYAYTKQERSLLKEGQARARSSESLGKEDKARLEEARQILLSPAMLKYNKLMTETLLSRLQQMETKEPGKSHMRSFLLNWRTRINLE